MSIEIQVTMTCDTCGSALPSRTEHRKGHAKSVLWDLEIDAEQAGWKEVNRGRFHTPTHYCPNCLDKPMKPVPRKNYKAAE